MEACLIIGGIVLTLGVIAVLVAVLRPLALAGQPHVPPDRRRPHSRFDFCPACDTELFANDRNCPTCRLDLYGRLAGRLERVRIARDELRHLREDGLLDRETAERVAEQFDHRKHVLLHPHESAERPAIRSREPAEARRPEPPVLPAHRPPVEVEPVAPVAETAPPPAAVPEPVPPRPSRRSLAEVFGHFMHERNILWGELAGGLLIVGCSIALVLSLWRTLEALPYFTFLLSAGITGAVFAAGQYTLHHWKLTATSRGLLVIALLLTPLNLLLLADPGSGGVTGAVDAGVKVAAVLVFALLVRTGGRDLVGTDLLPGRVPRRWLLALAVVGAPASLMLPPPTDVGPLAQLPGWLPLACFVAAGGLTVGRLSQEQRRAKAVPLGERTAGSVLLFIGLGLFALFVAWGFLLARPDNLAASLRHLAVPTVLCGIPVLAAGLLVQQRLTEPAGLRATGTAVALAGMVILFTSLVMAWPDPGLLIVAAAAVAAILGWVGYRDELPWAYAGAIPCAALAVVLGFHGMSQGWVGPGDLDPGRWLALAVTSATSGAVLVGFALILATASELFARRARGADALGYALGAVGVAAAGLMLVTVHGLDRPATAAWAHLAAAAGFVAASFRWRLRVVAQFGVWLVLLASLWGLWATMPGEPAQWGLVVATEGLLLAAVAVAMGRWTAGGSLHRLRDACRDVAAASAILAPAIAVWSPDLPRGAQHTGTLFAAAATVLILAGLYRQRALTWIGSLTALLAIAHWMVFTAEWEPRRGIVLLALLIHATLVLAAALLVRWATWTPSPAEPEQEGQWLGLYVEPLRRSARLTSCLAVPLLLLPVSGMAGAWAGLAVWTGVLWLTGATPWRERGAFPAFQAALTWATALVGFAWVERQDWFAATRSGAIDPRALQAYGVAVGLLSLVWVVARRSLRSIKTVQTWWAEVLPSVDRVVLAGLVVGQLILAIGGVLPAVVLELTPAGTEPALVPPAETAYMCGPGAWLLLGILTLTIGLVARWPIRNAGRADGPVIGIMLLALTVPFLVAGRFAGELAAASALRWGLAAVFLVGSAAVALREPIGRGARQAGFESVLSPRGPAWLRGLVAVAASVVILLSLQVAWLGFTGRAPTGPAAESIFRRMGWTASVIDPLAALVVGLAMTAVRERSPGYASAAGWVWTAAVAGGYALGVVTAGGTLDAVEQMRVGLLATGAVAAWALLWLAAGRRIPGNGLVTAQVVIGLAGLVALAAIPLVLILTAPARPLGPASGLFGQEGWAVLLLAVTAAYWHSVRVAPAWRLHVIGMTAALVGVLAACAVRPWDVTGEWLSAHVLAATWAAVGCGMMAVLVGRREADTRTAHLLWPQLIAAGLAALGLRGGWTDPLRPLVPAGTVLVAALLFGAVAYRLRSRAQEYLSGLLATLAAVLLWVTWGPDTVSSLELAAAVGLATAGAVGAAIRLTRGTPDIEDTSRPEPPGYDLLGLPPAPYPTALPPFPHFAGSAALILVLLGLVPTLSGADVEPAGLAWGAIAAAAVALGALLWDPRARYAAAGLYLLGLGAVGLALAELRPGPVLFNWSTPLALAVYGLTVSGIVAYTAARPDWPRRVGMPDRAPGGVHEWLLLAQSAVALLVIGMAVRTAVREAEPAVRLTAPVAVLLLIPAGAMLARRSSPPRAAWLRPATLALGAATAGVFAWALPDPAGVVPWLTRHGALFVALSAVAVVYAEVSRRWRPAPEWVDVTRRAAGVVGVGALAALGVFLVQQIPVFDPGTRTTPLDAVTIGAVIVALLAMIALALRFALRPDCDPLGPTANGRQGYVYLAEVLLVLLFAHVRLNIPQVFRPEAVRYWTFIVMLLAFVGVGLAELFARRGLRVLSRPLLRTGVLLPLIPLLAFWAKPPALLDEFARSRAPGLQPMIGYLKNLPQHYDAYALLWFLGGLLYGLIALSRRSFGWALLGALATNAGLWAMLTHHQVPAAVHPQAWAIPLALIVLVSEHVNRHRLRADVGAGLRYLGITMIYVSSAADLFIAGIGQSVWLPVILAVLCLAGVVAGAMLRVRAFLYLGIGFLLLDVFSMIWHAAVDRAQTWVWYASGIVLGAMILALFAVLEKRRNDVQELVGRLRQWNR